MGYKKLLSAGLVLGGSIVIVSAQAPRKPLVRKDLLVFGSGEIAPPIRDIFRPMTVATPPARRSVRPTASPTATRSSDVPAGFTLNISYIGSVNAGGRTIALVLRNGQTMSVGEGDHIAPGYKVVRVTAQEIVVEGPNSERKTFLRQGGRP
jgi:hypothetical protein